MIIIIIHKGLQILFTNLVSANKFPAAVIKLLMGEKGHCSCQIRIFTSESQQDLLSALTEPKLNSERC